MWPISTLPPSEFWALALAQRQKSMEALPSLPFWKQDSLFCFEGHPVLWQHIGKSVWNAEQSLPPSDPSEEAFWMLTSGLGERLEFWHPESARHHLWPGISHPLPFRSCVKTHPSVPSLLPGGPCNSSHWTQLGIFPLTPLRQASDVDRRPSLSLCSPHSAEWLSSELSRGLRQTLCPPHARRCPSQARLWTSEPELMPNYVPFPLTLF